MSTFGYQKWKKQESEQRIINALIDGDRSYSELLEVTELSKPILSQRLKNLEKQGKIESVPEKKTKRFLYHVEYEKLDDMEKALVLLHRLSNYILDCLEKFAKDPSISDEEYATRITESISILFTFRLFETIVLPSSIQEEWIRTVLGSEFVKRTPKLLRNGRDVMPFIFNGISPKEQAIYESKNVREAATKLLEFLSTIQKELARAGQ